MNHLWLVTWPHGADDRQGEQELTGLQKTLQRDGLGRIFPFDMPVLSVGTLDTLMGLSDDIVKLNMSVEAVLKKVERQYTEIVGPGAETLRVHETEVQHYLKDFHWDIAQFRHTSVPITDIVSQIQSLVAGIDEESKRLAVTLSEKNQALSLAQRKKVVNYSTSALEDFLTEENYQMADPVTDSDIFTTVLVVVGANQEEDFLTNYQALGGDIASFGGPEWDFDNSSLGKDDGNYGPYSSRSRVKGSPVTPAAPVKISSVGDSNLYSLVILKGHYEAGIVQADKTMSEGRFIDYVEPFIIACREKKLVVRRIDVDLETLRGGGAEAAIGVCEAAVGDVQYKAKHWCLAHFGELYSSWIHLKVIRGFVESVLRYGLHSGKAAKYTSCFVEPTAGREKVLEERLSEVIGSLRPELAVDGSIMEDDEEEETSESLFFVCHPFSLIGTKAGGQ
jgi:V-type H+-transporting ATPase subunit C